MRSPRLEHTSEGLELGAIAWCDATSWPGLERVVRWKVLGEHELSEPTWGEQQTHIESLGPDLAPQTGNDLKAHASGASVSITHRDGVAELWLDTGQRQTLVWRALSSAAAPTAFRGIGGYWVAWHHDVREESGEIDVPKWISVRFVRSDGRVLEPREPMVGIERDLDGEEQSFEFPQLVVGDDGALTLFGRGSHNFWRQDLNADGWSERQPLGDGQWGSRGRRVTAARMGDHLVTARREKGGLLVDWLPAPRGGAPLLVDAPIEPSSKRISVELDPNRVSFETHDGCRIFFGDIQQHSAHSDGTGTADEAYLRARWRYRDDFVALTDHESFIGKRTGPGEWHYLQEVADRYNDEGHFATLLAYEWTGKMYPGPGHKCVYLPARGMPLVSRDEVPEGRELVQRIKKLGGIASPHHIGWTGCDEEGHDPEGQPVWEICSCHGCYEHADHPLGMRGEHQHQLADVMLRKGHRFGFTASSDSHGLLWHHGESRKRDPYRTGLTAIISLDLSRSAILAALRNRRCYGTSGAKILLDVRIAGRPMGSETKASGPIRAWARARGESDLARVELIGPKGPIAHSLGKGRDAELDVELQAPSYLYVRAVQDNGEMAWASPVFFD